MNDRRADFDALHAFVRQGDQQAFAELARRHVDLVYGTALRKVSDPGAAQEISQTVFTTLARKAWRFAPEDSLSAWLHRTTLLESKQWWRGELRRRQREETAAQLGTTMKTPDDQPALQALVPLLDEALLSLRESDRTALLLRYYETRSMRDVSESLGVKEDAAQKRVAGALEHLARFFKRRGYQTVTVAAAAAALQQTTQAAPAVAVAAVFQTAAHTAPPALGVLSVLARLASLSKAQTAAVCIALAAGPVVWECKTIETAKAQITDVQNRIALLRSRQQVLNGQIGNLRTEAARSQAALMDTSESDARRVQLQRQMLALRERIRRLLSDPDYHWPADLAFVRIPKSTLKAMKFNVPVVPPGVLSSETRELLGLSPAEREAIEKSLARYFTDLDQRVDAAAYQTNHSPTPWLVPTNVKESVVFVIPPLGKEIAEAADDLFAEVEATLGPDRWGVFKRETNNTGTQSLRRILALDANRESQEFAMWVREANARHPFPTTGYSWSANKNGGYASSDSIPLAHYLPGAEASEMKYIEYHHLPGSLNRRIQQWLNDQAAVLIPNPAAR